MQGGEDWRGISITMDYYMNDIVDEEFVRRIHVAVNGKLSRWRNRTIDIVKRMKGLSLYDSTCLVVLTPE